MERLTKKQHQEIIDEIKLCENSLTKNFDVYVSNTISRLVAARIRLNLSILEEHPFDENGELEIKNKEGKETP